MKSAYFVYTIVDTETGSREAIVERFTNSLNLVAYFGENKVIDSITMADTKSYAFDLARTWNEHFSEQIELGKDYRKTAGFKYVSPEIA